MARPFPEPLTTGKDMAKKLSLKELTRMAFIWAEQDRASLADAWPRGTPEHEQAKAEAAQLREYRKKRWGKTQMEVAVEGTKSVGLYPMIEEERKRREERNKKT